MGGLLGGAVAAAVVTAVAVSSRGAPDPAEPDPTSAAVSATGSLPAPPPATPSIAADSPSPMPTSAPTPSPSTLATGSEQCADGSAGFAMNVPEGWYANLRQGDFMACMFLAREPFDPLLAGPGGPFVPPIRVTVAADSTPPGIVVQEGLPTSYGPHGAPAARWLVERAGDEWVVYVVPVRRAAGDAAAHLHLATRTGDAVAVAAVDGILERLTLYEPLRTDPSALARAEEVFTPPDVCVDLVRGLTVILPDSWWTNSAIDGVDACTYLAPGPFELTDPGTTPDGVVITLEVVAGNAATLEQILGIETLLVDAHRATRWELRPGLGAPPPDTRTYQYAIELDASPADGPTLVATLTRERSDDYDRERAILDEMMRRLIINPTPRAILERDPLPSCGWELVVRTVEGDLRDADARACLWEAYEAGEPAEMISVFPTVEGTIVREIYRVIGEGQVEVVADATHDHLGSGRWHIQRCESLERQDELVEPAAIFFLPESCRDSIALDP